jgi:hypothetical protein
MDRTSRPNTRLAAVWLSDPGKAMMQPTAPVDQAAQLTLDGCFIRGDGDLVACQLSRPRALDATNTLAALKGSFLSVDAAATPAATVPAGQMVLTLTKVTTYLTGNLVRLRAKDYLSLTPIHCTPTDCLFVAADQKPLIHLEDSDMEEKDLSKLLAWQGGGRIDYGNYSTMLDQKPPADEMPQQGPIKQDKWENLWGNNMGDKQVTTFRWTVAPPTADDPFWSASLLQFRPDPADACGADMDALDGRLPPTAPK